MALADMNAHTMNWHMRRRVIGVPARMLFPTEVVGRENLPKDTAFVLAVGPHKSYKETVLVPAYLQEYEFHILAKASLFKTPVFGYILRNAGGIAVFRDGGRGGESIAPAVETLKDGYPINVYPEATTRHRHDNDLHTGKNGAIRIALAAEVPIVPVGLRGMTKWSSASRSIHIGEPFDPRAELNRIQRFVVDKQPEGGLTRQLTDRLMQRIAALADTDYIGQGERDGRA